MSNDDCAPAGSGFRYSSTRSSKVARSCSYCSGPSATAGSGAGRGRPWYRLPSFGALSLARAAVPARLEAGAVAHMLRGMPTPSGVRELRYGTATAGGDGSSKAERADGPHRSPWKRGSPCSSRSSMRGAQDAVVPPSESQLRWCAGCHPSRTSLYIPARRHPRTQLVVWLLASRTFAPTHQGQ
jgi:hypothetical protein